MGRKLRAACVGVRGDCPLIVGEIRYDIFSVFADEGTKASAPGVGEGWVDEIVVSWDLRPDLKDSVAMESFESVDEVADAPFSVTGVF